MVDRNLQSQATAAWHFQILTLAAAIAGLVREMVEEFGITNQEAAVLLWEEAGQMWATIATGRTDVIDSMIANGINYAKLNAYGDRLLLAITATIREITLPLIAPDLLSPSSRQSLEDALRWFDEHDGTFCSGVKSAMDALRLYEYAMAHPEVPEFADSWGNAKLKAVLGYNPWKRDTNVAK